MFNLCKNCVQAVQAWGQKPEDNHPHIVRAYTQARSANDLFHNFVHHVAQVLPRSIHEFYTAIFTNNHLLGAQLSALSTKPTTITTNLINT